MKAKFKFIAGTSAFMLLIVAIFGFSIRKVSEKPAGEPQLSIDEIGARTTDLLAGEFPGMNTDIVTITPANWIDSTGIDFSDGEYSEVIDLFSLDSLDFSDVRDVALAGNQAFLATAGGIVQFYPADTSFVIYSYPQGLDNYDCYSVLPVEDGVYTGTSTGVWEIDNEGLIYPIWEEISDKVLVLKRFADCFYVGTESSGLYYVENDLVENILPGTSIIDVTKDQFGLWVATANKGLLFHDGEKWGKRYLRADTSSFAEVTCLLSAFQRLWVGTPKGVYVYDGGRWSLINAEDNLYDENVTTITRGKNFVYFGTANSGLFSYFNDSLCPLDFSENMQVTSLAISTKRYLIATETEGAILKTPRRQLHIQSLLNRSGRLAVMFQPDVENQI